MSIFLDQIVLTRTIRSQDRSIVLKNFNKALPQNPLFSHPESGFIRLAHVLKIIPVSKNCWYMGVRSGKFPRPIAISEGCKAYRVEDIRALIERLGSQVEGN